MRYRIEIQYDRGRQYVTIEADDSFDAARKAMAAHPSAFAVRVLKNLSYEDHERRVCAEQGYRMRSIYREPLETE